MNPSAPVFTDPIDNMLISQATSSPGTRVAWALQVSPAAASTDSTTNNIPFTHLLLSNTDVASDTQICLLPVLPDSHSAAVTPLHNMIIGETDSGMLYSMAEKDGYVIACPVPAPTEATSLEQLDKKCIVDNQMSVMRAVPPNAIQRQHVYKKEPISLETSEEQKPVVINTSKSSIPTPDIAEHLSDDLLVEHIRPHSRKRQTKPNITYSHIADSRVIPRAQASLPSSLQYIRGTVCAKRHIPARSRFGPVYGINKEMLKKDAQLLVSESVNKPIFLLNNENGTVTHIDVSDQDKSNWLSLLPVGERETANIWLYEESCQLFAIALRSLTPQTPLALGFSANYALEHCLPDRVPTVDLVQEMNSWSRIWRCEECARAVSSPALLQRHMDIYHMGNPNVHRRRYRCRECLRVFSKLFCLKRHMRNHHRKETAEPIEIKNDLTNPLDDVKMPSDESFQNILDFSSSFFDPDRSLPNLDISSSSKSASPSRSDFNSSSITIKDENRVDNYFNNSNGSPNRLDLQNNQPNDDVVKNSEKSFSCPYCGDGLQHSDLRKHVSTCRKRVLECCGRVFRNKQRLATHIRSQHDADKFADHQQVAQKPAADTGQDRTYSCEDCQIIFKRRGMLVNHLHRVHPERPHLVSGVPLLQRVRHYLCSACPKLYRTAVKRNIHMRVHHPGKAVSPGCVEGSVSRGEAAACSACHRQYATRAKLLQHVRSKHPHVVIPNKMTKNKPVSQPEGTSRDFIITDLVNEMSNRN